MLCHCRTISSQSLFRDWLCFFCQIAKTGEWKGRNFEVWYHLLPRSCFLFHMLLLLLFMYMFGCSDGLSVSFNICRHSFEHSKNLSTMSLLSTKNQKLWRAQSFNSSDQRCYWNAPNMPHSKIFSNESFTNKMIKSSFISTTSVIKLLDIILTL